MDVTELDGKVAVVTGAGGGLGRSHARLLAHHGAHVVVNDLSGAEAVVDEIRAVGGEAVANDDSVTTPSGGQAIVDAALEAFGRIDIVVNNAGILRDGAFHKLTDEQVNLVIDVHLHGAFNVLRPAWGHFREQGSGAVVNTTSAAGILGNFGQANYAAAKSGLVGLTNVLAIEGARVGIRVNAVAPIARTRMTENLLGDIEDRMAPELVSPLVVWLASPDCETTGAVYTVGGGRIARFHVGLNEGWARNDGELTVADVREHWEAINDLDTSRPARGLGDDFRALKRTLASS